MIKKLSDEDLMRKFQNGDNAAFNELMERYEKEIFKRLYVKYYDKNAISDLYQNIFVEIYEKRHTYNENKGTVKKYIRAITTNMVNRHLKKEYYHDSPIKEVSNQNITKPPVWGEHDTYLVGLFVPNPDAPQGSQFDLQKISYKDGKLKNYDKKKYKERTRTLPNGRKINSLVIKDNPSIILGEVVTTHNKPIKAIPSTPAGEQVSQKEYEPEFNIELEEVEERLLKCLKKLTEKYQNIIIDYKIHNETIDEISKKLGITIDAVKKRASRGWRMFSKCMGIL